MLSAVIIISFFRLRLMRRKMSRMKMRMRMRMRMSLSCKILMKRKRILSLLRRSCSFHLSMMSFLFLSLKRSCCVRGQNTEPMRISTVYMMTNRCFWSVRLNRYCSVTEYQHSQSW
jgi:hypothetical protein